MSCFPVTLSLAFLVVLVVVVVVVVVLLAFMGVSCSTRYQVVHYSGREYKHQKCIKLWYWVRSKGDDALFVLLLELVNLLFMLKPRSEPRGNTHAVHTGKQHTVSG